MTRTATSLTPLVLLLCTSEKSMAPPSLHLPIRWLQRAIRSASTFSPPGHIDPTQFPPSHVLQCPTTAVWSFSNEEPKTGHSFQIIWEYTFEQTADQCTVLKHTLKKKTALVSSKIFENPYNISDCIFIMKYFKYSKWI